MQKMKPKDRIVVFFIKVYFRDRLKTVEILRRLVKLFSTIGKVKVCLKNNHLENKASCE